jgi:hypothetical protein
MNSAIIGLYPSLLKSKKIDILSLTLKGIADIACNSPQLRNIFILQSGFASIL